MINFWICLSYSVFLILFGYTGFYRTGSLMSLCSGVCFGIFGLIFSYAMYKRLKWGEKGALFLTALLTVLFTVRAIASQKPVPIFLAVLSALVFGVLKQRKEKAIKDS